MKFRCVNCGAFFDDYEADYRNAVIEDCVAPYEKIMTCPCCGCDEVEEETTCIVCSQPTGGKSDEMCEECKGKAIALFDSLFVDSYAEETGKSREEMKEILLDILCN